MKLSFTFFSLTIAPKVSIIENSEIKGELDSKGELCLIRMTKESC